MKTSVDLSRQDEGDEMFGSSAVARSIVRSTMSASENIAKIIARQSETMGPTAVLNQRCDDYGEWAAFDLIRACCQFGTGRSAHSFGNLFETPSFYHLRNFHGSYG